MGSRYGLRAFAAAIITAASLAGAVGATARPVSAAITTARFAPWIGRAWGLVPAVGHASVGAGPSTAPVVFHGGVVMRNVRIHTVFWAPAGHAFPGAPTAGAPTYEGLLQRFFTDAAQASGGAASALSVMAQYGDMHGAGSNALSYAAATDSIDDADPYPAPSRQCSSPAGLPTCLTAGQVETELDHVVARQDPSGRGLHDLWVLMLPPNVDECILGPACGTTMFAGYHSEFDLGHGPTIYALIVNPVIEGPPPAGSDPQGNPIAEAAADVAAHETVEAVTDPEGTGWIDPSGSEVGDKCQGSLGALLGYAPDGSPYNQLLAGDPFLIQTMWSNTAAACASHGSAARAPSVPSVALHQFSAVVRGASAATRPGISVSVQLVRAGTPVAEGHTTVRRGGAWTLTLHALRGGAPVAVGDDRDELDVDYGRGGPGAETILTGQGGNPQGQAGFTGWSLLDSGVTVNRHAVTITPCSQVGVLRLTVAGEPAPSPVERCRTSSDVSVVPTGPIGAATSVSLTSSDNRAASSGTPRGALVALTIIPGEPGAVIEGSDESSASPSEPVGLPVCTADLGRQIASCADLVPGHRYRISTRAVTLTARADQRGRVRVAAHRHAAWLIGGDILTLAGPTGRVLSRLHIAHLHVALTDTGHVIGGACQAGEYWGPPTSLPPTSSLSLPFLLLGLTAAMPSVCPLDGHAAGLPAGSLEQTDSFSAGTTLTEVPRLSLVSPGNGATLYGPFIAVAQVGFAPAGPAPTVSLHVMRAGSARPIVAVANVLTPHGTRLRALRPGLYHATWTLTDRNGDTRTLHTSLVQEP